MWYIYFKIFEFPAVQNHLYFLCRCTHRTMSSCHNHVGGKLSELNISEDCCCLDMHDVLLLPVKHGAGTGINIVTYCVITLRVALCWQSQSVTLV